MAFSGCPAIRRGTQLFPFMLVMSAPMERRGVIIRFIGRLWMELSPVSSDTKFCPARIPEIRRVVVPLFPTSKMSVGEESPRSPFPWTRISPLLFSMSMPILRKQEMVERQSAPSRKWMMRVVPLAREPNMTARWEMDLSPGTVISPWRLVNFFISIIIVP